VESFPQCSAAVSPSGSVGTPCGFVVLTGVAGVRVLGTEVASGAVVFRLQPLSMGGPAEQSP